MIVNKLLPYTLVLVSFQVIALPKPSWFLPAEISTYPPLVYDNDFSHGGVTYEVMVRDNLPESEYNKTSHPGIFPKTYFTPEIRLTPREPGGGTDWTKTSQEGYLIPIDWARGILARKDSLPEWIKPFIPNALPEIPTYALLYHSRVYPGTTYIVLRPFPSLKELGVKYLQEHKELFKGEFGRLPQELQEEINK